MNDGFSALSAILNSVADVRLLPSERFTLIADQGVSECMPEKVNSRGILYPVIPESFNPSFEDDSIVQFSCGESCFEEEKSRLFRHGAVPDGRKLPAFCPRYTVFGSASSKAHRR